MALIKMSKRAETRSENSFRWSVDKYHEMVHAGILTSDDPVELLEGEIVTKMSKNPPHSYTKRVLRRALEQILPAGFFADEECPVTTSDSEPEPDITIIRGTVKSFAKRHPTPKDIALLVEIADSSLTRDQTVKLRVYARAGIGHYWLVNLVDKVVEVYSEPKDNRGGPTYGRRQRYSKSQSVPVTIDGTLVGKIRVADILPID